MGQYANFYKSRNGDRVYNADSMSEWLLPFFTTGVFNNCFAVTATLMAYEMSKMTGVPAFAQTSSILNNIALVAFCLSLLWTLFAGRDEQNYRDRFKKDGARLLVLLLGACAVMTALSILFV